MGTEASALQSGFVIGVVIAGLLLARQLGGVSAVALRFAQLTLALVLTMLVFGATLAVEGLLDIEFGVSGDVLESALGSDPGGAAPGVTQHTSVVGTVHTGVAIFLVAGGVAMLRRWNALAPAILLGGVLLMLFAASPGAITSDTFQLLGLLLPPAVDDAGDARNIARVLVLLAGALLLAGAIHLRWGRELDGDSGEAGEPRAG